MVFVDYTINNYCKRCEHRFSKNLGNHCPLCKRQARTVPRKTVNTPHRTLEDVIKNNQATTL